MPSNPLTLGFDTSAAHCAAALLCGDDIVAQHYAPMKRGQAETLVPLLEQTLRDGGAVWADLDRIGVGIGPGNFTGIRISVSCARGLALSLGVPAIGVSNFAVAALGHPAPVMARVPAPRDEACFAAAPDFTDPVLAPADTAWDMPVVDMPAPDRIAPRIARIAAAHQGQAQRPAPLYVRAPDAAPPKDAPPVILP